MPGKTKTKSVRTALRKDDSGDARNVYPFSAIVGQDEM